MKRQSWFQQSEQDSCEDCVQKLLKADYVGRNQNKIIMMLQKFDQKSIDQLKKYLDQHRHQAWAKAKYRQFCIQRRNFLPSSLKKYSLYQDIQFHVILYDFFRKVDDQVKNKGRSWRMRMIKDAAKQIQRVFCVKFYRELKISTILRQMSIRNDLTPQVFKFCIAKGVDVIRDYQSHKMTCPSKADLKDFFNPLKDKIKTQKNSRKRKQREYIIVQDQQLQSQRIQSFAQAKIQEPIQIIEARKTNQRLRKSKRLGNNKVIDIQDDKKTSPQSSRITKAKIQFFSNSNSEKKKKEKLKLAQDQNITIQEYQNAGFQRSIITPSFVKVEEQKPFELSNEMMQDTFQSIRDNSRLILRNETTPAKFQSHDQQSANFLFGEFFQQQHVQRIKKILLTNSESFTDDLEKFGKSIIHRDVQSCAVQKEVQSCGVQKQFQSLSSQKKGRKDGISKVIIISILLDLLQELSE